MTRIYLALVTVLILLPSIALAQEAAAPAEIVITDPTGGLLAMIPGGIFIYGIVVMLAGLVTIFTKDSALPAFLSKILNALAMNVGRAKNDPAEN